MIVAGPRALTAAQQYLQLRANPICAGTGRLAPGRLMWRYATTPTSLSRLYTIRVEYRQGQSPQVFVEEPDLIEISEGRRLPHVYQQCPPRLCLYFPTAGEWRPFMRLDQTVVPWTTLWLFYFEEWLISDEWKGGGIHLPTGRTRRKRRTTTRRRPAIAGPPHSQEHVDA